MDLKYKNILIGILLTLVLIIAAGYAAFATQLNINGTGTITTSWDVHIKTITPGTPVGDAKNLSAVPGDDNLSATFNTELISPGDSLTYTIVVENNGSLDATLDDIAFDQGTKTVNGEEVTWTEGNAIIYTTTAVKGTDISKNGGTYTFTVTVTFKGSIQTQPTGNDIQSKLAMQLSYIQKTNASA